MSPWRPARPARSTGCRTAGRSCSSRCASAGRGGDVRRCTRRSPRSRRRSSPRVTVRRSSGGRADVGVAPAASRRATSASSGSSGRRRRGRARARRSRGRCRDRAAPRSRCLDPMAPTCFAAVPSSRAPSVRRDRGRALRRSPRTTSPPPSGWPRELGVLARARAGARAARARRAGGGARVPGRRRGAPARRVRRAARRPRSASSATSAARSRITVHGDYDVDGVALDRDPRARAAHARRGRRLVPAEPDRRRLRARRARPSSGSPRAGPTC